MTRAKETSWISIRPRGTDSQPLPRWELVYEITKHLQGSWKVSASRLQELGHFAGSASGPGGMQLFFIARTQKLDPTIEASCPPLGWLRVGGRFPSAADWDKTFKDGIYRPAPEPKLSIELPVSLTAKQIAHEISLRFLPLYAGFLRLVKGHNKALDQDQTNRRSLAYHLPLLGPPAPGQAHLQDASELLIRMRWHLLDAASLDKHFGAPDDPSILEAVRTVLGLQQELQREMLRS